MTIAVLVCHLTQNVYLQVTVENIKAIDRKSQYITSNLELITIPELSIIEYVYTDKQIKEEPAVEYSINFGDEDCIKEEDHDYDSFPLLDHGMSSDDDEPLSHHKEKKSLVIRKKEETKIEDEKFDLNELESLEVDVSISNSFMIHI